MFDKKNGLPLYMQLRKELAGRIISGELKPGDPIPTEQELCKEFGISRFPVRQAMEELVAEGYLTRTRGRGTFVCAELPPVLPAGRKKLLGLVMGSFAGGLGRQILAGFEKQARKRGYLVVACCSEAIPGEELDCVDRLLESDAAGMFVFPTEESRIGERLDRLQEAGVYLGFLDRNPGLSGIDYIGSDNVGGAYTAVRHLALQGYRNVAFVSDKSNVSSVNERLEGYLKAVGDFGLKSVTHIDIDEDLGRYPYSMYRFFLDKLKDELVELKRHMPLGIFCINDGVALQCMRILRSEGMEIGRDVGLIGFDNEPECEFLAVPLTSVAQNGLLIGQTAAGTAIDKIEGKGGPAYRSFVPTQLVIRSSCGERG